MEIKEENIAWLNPNHPNYLRWKRSRELSIERGKFVKSVIQQTISCKGLTILDLGSGEGGTSKVLAEENKVVSFDFSIIRLKRQNSGQKNINKINGDGLQLPFKSKSFDLIILQDVIEHVNSPNILLQNILEVLKDNGTVYLSTPNKLSIFNIFADPHWGFPFVALMSREKIKKYFFKYFRKQELNRNGIAQLLSLKETLKLVQTNFEYSLNTQFSVNELLNGNKGIIWSKFHLKLLKIVNKLGLNNLLVKIANDNSGVINNYFNPTFYFILTKI